MGKRDSRHLGDYRTAPGQGAPKHQRRDLDQQRHLPKRLVAVLAVGAARVEVAAAMKNPNEQPGIFHLEADLLTDSCVVFYGGMGPQRIVTFHGDGRVEVDPKYEVDDAAKAFWDAVRKLAALHG